MKFGATLQHLQVERWKDKYVAYNSIKKLLKAPSSSQGEHFFGEAEEEAFMEQLDSELEKVRMVACRLCPEQERLLKQLLTF